MNIAQEIFIKYVRTKMMFSLRYRNEGDLLQPVHIPANEIAERFFPYPKYNRNNELKQLYTIGEIRITQKGRAYYYEALKPGGYDLNLLQNTATPNDNVTQNMLTNIKKVSLPANVPSTPYFDLFLKYKDTKAELFFKVDDFCGRVHTPISNFHRTHRPNLLIDSEVTTSLDVATMQPLLLGKILSGAIGENEYSTWINQGKDIYIELQNKAALSSRDEAKKKFFEILFSKPNDALKELFGATEWINWINTYKQFEEPSNPHSKDKPHSNLAWLLQSTEVTIMRKVWAQLVNFNIPFFSVHDEIIVKELHYSKARAVFEDVLIKEFTYFKINTKEFNCVPVLESKEFEISSIQIPLIEYEHAPAQTQFKPFSKQFPPLWDITELEACFKALQVPEQPIKLNAFCIINNPKHFIDGHIEIVKHNNGNKTFAPYYDRLIELKAALTAS